MSWVFAVVLVLLIGAVAVVAAGHGQGLAPSQNDDPAVRLPDHRLGPEDLRRVRFNLAFRGYRAAEVDRLLARLAAEWDQDERGPERGAERGTGRGTGRGAERADGPEDHVAGTGIRGATADRTDADASAAPTPPDAERADP